MAQTMFCDVPEHEHPADVVITRLDDGLTLAVCNAAYVELCRATVDQADTLAARAEAEAAASPAAIEAAEAAEVDAADRDALDRLNGHRAPTPDDPTPATVVRRGTSRSRKAHEARQRAQRAKAAPEAVPDADGHPGRPRPPRRTLRATRRPRSGIGPPGHVAWGVPMTGGDRVTNPDPAGHCRTREDAHRWPTQAQPFAKPLAWWGIIQAGVTDRQTTAELWSTIHSYSADHGLAEPPNLWAQVNSLRSASATLRDRGQAFLRADPSLSLSADYIGQLPYARDLGAQAVTQRYLARVGFLVTGTQGPDLRYVTLDIPPGGLPGTVGGLLDEIDLAASDAADAYDETVEGIDSIQIGAW